MRPVRITTKDGEKRQVPAKKEIILAAGTIKSSQLLELSGIGSATLPKSYSLSNKR